MISPWQWENMTGLFRWLLAPRARVANKTAATSESDRSIWYGEHRPPASRRFRDICLPHISPSPPDQQCGAASLKFRRGVYHKAREHRTTPEGGDERTTTRSIGPIIHRKHRRYKLVLRLLWHRCLAQLFGTIEPKIKQELKYGYFLANVEYVSYVRTTTGWPKKPHTIHLSISLLSISLLNIDRFS